MSREISKYYLERSGPPVLATVGELKLITGYKLVADAVVRGFDDPECIPLELPAGQVFYVDTVRASTEANTPLETATGDYRFIYLAEVDSAGIRISSKQELAVAGSEATRDL
jgi:hypothetical protein